MHSYSVKLVINQQRVKEGGLCSLYLRTIIDRKVIPVKLGLSWPKEFVDLENGRILPRKKKGDPDFRDYEMIIITELGKINEIFKVYRLQDRTLTPELFKKELKTFTRRKDFIIYMSEDIKCRHKMREIAPQTYRNHMTTLHQLIRFSPVVPFHAMDSKFLTKFANWLRGDDNKNEEYTIWSRIQNIKTYLHRAEEEGMGINPDFKKYQNKEGKGRIVYLEESQIKAIMDLPRKYPDLSDTHKCTMKAFLFSCFTSLRISDVQRANWGWVNIRSEMVFLPWKTRKFGRLVTVPLTGLAKRFIDKQKGTFFTLPTEQEINRSLKDLARMAGIDVNLTFHVARHTFATLYYRRTGDIMSLKDIMGHKKIEHTMIYAHINNEDKRRGMDKFEHEMAVYLYAYKNNIDID